MDDDDYNMAMLDSKPGYFKRKPVKWVRQSWSSWARL